MLNYLLLGLSVFSDFSVILQVNAYRIMNSTNEFSPKVVYTAPSLRLVNISMEAFFLASNLEPIEGGDDPDIDW